MAASSVRVAASARRHLLVIEEATETINAIGEPEVAWTTFATVRGTLEPLSGREVLIAAQLQSNVTARANIRRLPGLTTKMRIRNAGRVYDITYIANTDERAKDCVLMLSEGLKS